MMNKQLFLLGIPILGFLAVLRLAQLGLRSKAI